MEYTGTLVHLQVTPHIYIKLNYLVFLHWVSTDGKLI